MKLFLKFDFNTLAKIHLENVLATSNVAYKTISFGEIEISDRISESDLEILSTNLQSNGIEIIENQKAIFVQKIKDCIIDMIQAEENIMIKSSVFLAEKLDHSYGYISNMFSEITYTSIENFIIIQKIELAKQLLVINELSLTEIAFKLNYSSVAHLSTQFKNTTGITPSAFQRIITKRKEIATKN